MVLSVVSAKIRIPRTIGIDETISVYRRALQLAVDSAWTNGIKNNVRLHHVVYKDLRLLGLPSQLCVACIKQAAGIVKKAKTRPVIRRASIGYNFPRSANLSGNKLTYRLLDKRESCTINVPTCYAEYFKSWTVGESKLLIDKRCRAFFFFSFSKEVNIERDSTQHVLNLGADLGVNNLAVTSDGRFFHSSQAKVMKRKYKFLRRKLQVKGTRASERLLKRLSGRETRYMTWINHNISKRIAMTKDVGRIVLEDLKGIRKKNRGKTMNYWIGNWSFFQLQSFIEYKAVMRGITVSKVSPFMTSQLCHKCGLVGTRNHGSFSCSCGLRGYSADLNAARNLAHPMLVERQAAVTQPYISCDERPAVMVVLEHRDESPVL